MEAIRSPREDEKAPGRPPPSPRNLLAKKEAAAEQAAAELLREEDEAAARANKKRRPKKKKKKRRGAATAAAEPDEAKADGPAAATVDEPEAKEDASPALERLTLADESNDAEETMAPAPADATESPTIAAPEGAAIAATQRPKKTNLLATWQREREEAAMRPVPPAFDSTRRGSWPSSRIWTSSTTRKG